MQQTPPTLSELVALFVLDLERRRRADEIAPRTVDYYRNHLERDLLKLDGGRPADQLRPLDLHRAGLTSWHHVQCLQRLYNWGEGLDLVGANPLKKMRKAARPGRQRVLTAGEWRLILSRARPPLERFLRFQRLTLARPGEVRSATWADYRREESLVVLSSHKTRRTAAVSRPRVIVLNALAVALVEEIAGGHLQLPTRRIFLNGHGTPWTTSALRIAVRRLCRRCGLDAAEGERIVAYSIRHTGATAATAAGVRDRKLADIMGHASTRTTGRYQHLDVAHLRDDVEKIAA